MTPKKRIVDPQNILLRVIAAEAGCSIAELRPSTLHQVQVALVECYRRGLLDAHERSTVRPPDADAGPEAPLPSWATSPTTPPPGRKA